MADLEVAYWVPKYLFLRGEQSLSSLGTMSVAMAEVSQGFDTFGWTEVLHRKVYIVLCNM